MLQKHTLILLWRYKYGKVLVHLNRQPIRWNYLVTLPRLAVKVQSYYTSEQLFNCRFSAYSPSCIMYSEHPVSLQAVGHSSTEASESRGRRYLGNTNNTIGHSPVKLQRRVRKEKRETLTWMCPPAWPLTRWTPSPGTASGSGFSPSCTWPSLSGPPLYLNSPPATLQMRVYNITLRHSAEWEKKGSII